MQGGGGNREDSPVGVSGRSGGVGSFLGFLRGTVLILEMYGGVNKSYLGFGDHPTFRGGCRTRVQG